MKAKLDKLLLALLLVCALTAPAGFADGGEAPGELAATPAPTAEAPANAIPEETAPVASAEPDVAPSAAPTAEPTPEPSAEPAPEPTPEPSAEPTPEASVEPTVEPTAEPTISPEPTVSPEPGTTALPEHIEEDFVITIENGSQQEDGSWRVEVSEPDAQLILAWTYPEEASQYQVYEQEDEESMRLIGETDRARMELSAADYRNGRHVIYVSAQLADGELCWGMVAFELEKQQGGFPGSRPGGSFPGGFDSMGGMAQEEKGFSVTPGEALTSKHSSGTKNTAAYASSEIAASEEAMTALALDSTQTEITLDNGAAFFVSNEDGTLYLMPESEGSQWRLSVLAMNTLSQSGVDRVVFQLDGASCSLPAQMEFSGSVYASLRAKGYVSKDMELCVDAQGVRVHIADGVYSISDSGELMPCEE